MLPHMRTSIDLADGLLARARRLARQRGITLRALVEEGLRRVLSEQRDTPPAFRLEDVTFGQGGVTGDCSESDWERLRELTYEGRGS
jgi:hypothetical protein